MTRVDACELLVLLTAFASVVACGGSGDSSSAGGTGGTQASGGTGTGAKGGTSGSGGAPGGGAGGTSASGGSAGASGSSCPASPPSPGSACTVPWSSTTLVEAHCSWGDDPRPGCRASAKCVDSKWEVNPPATECQSPPLPAACPNPAPADKTQCSDTALGCWYADGKRCWCSACEGGSAFPNCQVIDPPEWYCAVPGPNCPTVMPQAGSPCSVPDASCGPDCSFAITCKDGVWQWLEGDCPICAAPNTPVATPSGTRPISSLRVGDLVYSVDRDAIVAVPLAKVGRTPVRSHRVVRVVLESGELLEISPGHPTADGGTFGDLRVGARLDEAHTVKSVELVPYGYDATYDILPSSSSGTYFAAGALIGSTLR